MLAGATRELIDGAGLERFVLLARERIYFFTYVLGYVGSFLLTTGVCFRVWGFKGMGPRDLRLKTLWL